jgi:hypothetical protein
MQPVNPLKRKNQAQNLVQMEGKEFKRLTIEDVRKSGGFEHRSDAEIRQIIIAVEKIALLIIKKFNKQKPP